MIAIRTTVILSVFYLVGAIDVAVRDYTALGQTVRASVLWGAFWGPREVCKAWRLHCIPPYGVVRDDWILDFRPEVRLTIEQTMQRVRTNDLIERPEI